MHWHYIKNNKILINLDRFETIHDIDDLWLPIIDEHHPNHKLYNLNKICCNTRYHDELDKIYIRKDLYNFIRNNNLFIIGEDNFILHGIDSEQMCLLFELKFS